MGITHKKTLSLPDGVDPADVQPSNWNDDHTITGDVDCASHKLVNLTDPASAQDAATKAYVDTHASVSPEQSATGLTAGGVADNSSAVLAAITSAQTSGKRLVLPSGTYKLASTVVLPAGVTRIRGDGTIFTFDSTARDAFSLTTGTTGFTIEGVTFQGASSDDKDVNVYSAIQISNGAGIATDLGTNDIIVSGCRFEKCTPVESDDSFHTARLHFTKNYVHNPPNGIHPPSDSSIEDCDFVNDTYVSTRSEFIYQYGQQTNLSVINCRFKNGGPGPDVQIRSTNPRMMQRFNFRIEGCHFENTNGYSIWVGSDDKPDISDIIISGNTFRNCVTPINCRGGAVITSNNLMWDAENPNTITPGAGLGISVLGGQGASGARSTLRGVIISGNRLVNRHPFVAKLTLTTQPQAADTVTVGAFTYTWVASGASTEGQVNIGTDVNRSAQNLAAAIQGSDGIMTAPNNVLRNVTDCFVNQLATANSESNGNIVYVASWNTFSTSSVGGRLTAGAASDMRDASTYGISVGNVIAPLIQGNLSEDLLHCVVVSDSVQPAVYDNICSLGVQQGTTGFKCLTNNQPHWRGNRMTIQYASESNIGAYPACSSAFPVIEDLNYARQLSVRACGGRTGVVTIGDGKAYTYLYYGNEQAASIQPYTRPWRWDDGDQIALSGNTYTFQRTSPGANQFNSAAGLISLINASTWYRASFETLVNDYSATDPHMWIKIKAVSAGAGFNSGFTVWPLRYRKPGDTTTYITVPGPLINCVILREPNHEYASLHGGCDNTSGGLGATKTFVMSPIASADRPVLVYGTDAPSNALDPVVYQSDIVPGVGFTITHDASITGNESFFWRVG